MAPDWICSWKEAQLFWIPLKMSRVERVKEINMQKGEKSGRQVKTTQLNAGWQHRFFSPCKSFSHLLIQNLTKSDQNQDCCHWKKIAELNRYSSKLLSSSPDMFSTEATFTSNRLCLLLSKYLSTGWALNESWLVWFSWTIEMTADSVHVLFLAFMTLAASDISHVGGSFAQACCCEQTQYDGCLQRRLHSPCASFHGWAIPCGWTNL